MQEVQEENANSNENARPSKKRRSLRLPDSYKKEKLKLDLEGKEVYLIRAPADFDMQRLDGKRICLNTGTHQVASGEGVQLVADVALDDDNNPLVVAQSTDGSLVKGTICIRHNISVPDPVLPQATEQMTNRYEITKDLKQRYVPFGSVDMTKCNLSQSKVQHRKKKKITRNQQLNKSS